MAGEPVEVQVRVEDDDPGVNTRGLVMLGIAVGEHKQCTEAIKESVFLSQEHVTDMCYIGFLIC